MLNTIKNKYNLIAFGLIILGLLLRLWLLNTTSGPTIMADEHGYMQNARYIASIFNDKHLISSYPFGYSLFLAPAALISANNTLLFYRLIILTNIFIGLFTVYIAYLFLKDSTKKHSFSIICASTIFLYPPFVMYSGFALSENLYFLIQIFYLFLVFKYFQNSNLKTLFLIIVVSFFAFLTRENGVSNILVSFIILIINKKNKLKHVVVFILLTLIFLLLTSTIKTDLFDAQSFLSRGGKENSSSVAGIFSKMQNYLFWFSLPSVFAGIAMYIGVSTFGFFYVPIIVMINNIKNIRKKLKKPITKTFIIYILLFLSNITIFSIFMTLGPRGDHRIYGRYSEPFILVWIVLSISLYYKNFLKLRDSINYTALISLVLFLISLTMSSASSWMTLPLNFINIINLQPVTMIFPNYTYIAYISIAIFIIFITSMAIRRKPLLILFLIIILYGMISVFSTKVYYMQINTRQKSEQMIKDMILIQDNICYDRSFFSAWEFFNYQIYDFKNKFIRLRSDNGEHKRCKYLVSSKSFKDTDFAYLAIEYNADQALFVNHKLLPKVKTYNPNENIMDLKFRVDDVTIRNVAQAVSYDMKLQGKLTNQSQQIFWNTGTVTQAKKPVRVVVNFLDENNNIINKKRCDLKSTVLPKETINFNCKLTPPINARYLYISLVQESVSHSKEHTNSYALPQLNKQQIFIKNKIKILAYYLEINLDNLDRLMTFY